MEKKKVSFKVAATNSRGNQLGMLPPERLALMSADVIMEYLKKIIMQKGTHLEIDLAGIHDIDNRWFDAFNLLSRLSRKYGSSVTLTGVEPDILEIIELIRKYYFFDIRVVEPA